MPGPLSGWRIDASFQYLECIVANNSYSITPRSTEQEASGRVASHGRYGKDGEYLPCTSRVVDLIITKAGRFERCIVGDEPAAHNHARPKDQGEHRRQLRLGTDAGVQFFG